MLPIKQPPNGAGPRHLRTSGPLDAGRCYMVSLTVFASALLATLVTFGILNFLLNGASLPPLPAQAGLAQDAAQQQAALQAGGPAQPPQAAAVPGDARLPGAGALAAAGNGTGRASAPGDPQAPAPSKPPPAAMDHPFDDLARMYTLPEQDTSPRCAQSKICDGDHSCGPDNRGCITSAKERKDHVRKAIAWAWEGYRKYAWGHDEVDVLTKSPHAWFNLGLTIVDSLDTLLIAGLMDEYQEARHWVANHLVFHDGSTVQFFEVNIRILGGLVSAYYLSDGDDLYLHKAEQLADRLMVAFNTSSGMPVTHVALQDAAGRARSGGSDSQTNIAEAGTISMEFTSIGRLLGRDDMFDAGMQFWYVLMSSRNFSGLYCMGIHTSRADCYNPQMTIGSAADSTYEYMLKQWVLSNHTQEVPRLLYEESMKGTRKYLVRHVWDGQEDMSIVSEASADTNSGHIGETNNRFEHLTCFAGGMFVLGAIHNLSTVVDENDFDDAILGARIGRACYELYHQAASGLAPDSVTFKQDNGAPLKPRGDDKYRPEGVLRHRPGRKNGKAAGASSHGGQEALQPALDSLQLPHDVAKPVQPAKAALAAPQASTSSSSKDAAAPPKPADKQAQKARKLQDSSADRESGGDAAAAAAARGLALRHLLDQPQEAHQLSRPQHGAHGGLPHAARQYMHAAQWGGLRHREHAAHGAGHWRAKQHAELLGRHGRQLMQVEDEEERQEQHLRHLHERPPHAPHGEGAELRRRHVLAGGEGPDEDGPDRRRRHVPLDEEEIRRVRARRLEGRGDPPDRLRPEEAAKAAADQRAAAAAQQERLAAQQHERAAHDAEEQQRREAEEAARRRHAEERQQAAQHQQAAQQHLSQAQAEQLLRREAANEGASKEAAAAPQAAAAAPLSPSPSPPPPQPPPGPYKASWSQMTAADFLRPETIETLFYLWRATGDEIYREWGWNMFRAFERWTRLETGGYATVTNVNSVPPALANKMESFWVAETLKYFYLLFEDDPNVLPLDKWVFNTEAHPLPIWGTEPDKKAMERLKLRRYAAKLKERQHNVEDEAVAELQDIKRQGAELAQRAPQRGKPQDREGYGLGGLEMY